MKREFFICALVLFILLQLACGRKNLDRQAAAKLLEGRVVETVNGSFSASPGYAAFRGQGDATAAYQQLAQAGVLQCATGNITGTTCQPGPNGSGLNTTDMELTFTAGQLVVSGVTGITMTGKETATADVALAFQASPLYSQYQGLLDQVDTGSRFQAPLGQRTRGRQGRAQFQRYDDGWRVESLQ